MYRSTAIAELLQSHRKHASTKYDVMRSPIDSPAWKHVDREVDVAFGQEIRNLRFEMSLDGINPFPQTNSTHSTWPIFIIIYNLPPFLVMKKFFVQLFILIPGKESPTSDNVDVYIQPLIDEL
jgi:hypothetical protein